MNTKNENGSVMEQADTGRSFAPATEIINMLGNQCTRLVKIIKYILIFSGLVLLYFAVVNYRYSQANERNNQRWIEYLSQYDFVSQDGEGYNYYNSDVGGDVVNGMEN